MSEENANQGIPFSAFVLSLSTMAMASLGQCDDPAFADMPRDPDIARNNIDILLMLRDKTKGNLTDAEQKLLNSVIYDLQMHFLREPQK